MIIQKQASAIIIISIFAGIVLSPAVDQQQVVEGFSDQLSKINENSAFGDKSHDHNHREQRSSNFTFGTAHEHALFHIVVNGTERDFTADRFQLQSDYVHLENNKSDIVHKHAEGVKWKDFFQTINTTVERKQKGELCVSIYGEKKCGTGKVVLNGESGANLTAEIHQNDNFLIVLNTDNLSQLVEDYMNQGLSELYKPSERRGKRI